MFLIKAHGLNAHQRENTANAKLISGMAHRLMVSLILLEEIPSWVQTKAEGHAPTMNLVILFKEL
jgi:hypothetical protein